MTINKNEDQKLIDLAAEELARLILMQISCNKNKKENDKHERQ